MSPSFQITNPLKVSNNTYTKVYNFKCQQCPKSKFENQKWYLNTIRAIRLWLMWEWWQNATTIITICNIWVPWSQSQAITTQTSNLLTVTYWQSPPSPTCTSLEFSSTRFGSVWGAANKFLRDVYCCSSFGTDLLVASYWSTIFFIGWFWCTGAIHLLS